MEVGISRRAALAGGIAALCGVAMPRTVFADEAKAATGTLAEIAGMLAELGDDEVELLETLVADEKSARGIKSIPIGCGTFTAGKDIDPGTYIIRTYTTPDAAKNGDEVVASYYLTTYNEETGEWDWDKKYDDVYGDGEYMFTITDGMQVWVSVSSDGNAVITPGKMISFTEE